MAELGQGPSSALDSTYGAMLIGGEELFPLGKSTWHKLPVNQSFLLHFFKDC